MAGSVEQGHSDLPLQCADELGDRRLRDAQLLGSTTEAAGLSDGLEATEVTQFHAAQTTTPEPVRTARTLSLGPRHQVGGGAVLPGRWRWHQKAAEIPSARVLCGTLAQCPLTLWSYVVQPSSPNESRDPTMSAPSLPG